MESAIDIQEFGARAGGLSDASAAIGAAIGKLKARGGGTLLVPAGIFLTGPIELFSGITLILEKDAKLLFVDDPERYPPVRTRWEGLSCWAMRPLVFAQDAKNVAIRGEGTLDGNGASWWAAHKAKKASGQAGPVTPSEKRLGSLNGASDDQPSGGGGRQTQFLRPPLVQFLSCEDVFIEGISMVNSPFWTLHPVFTDRLRIVDVRIVNPADAPNTDGIDVDSCVDVSISGTLVDVGDDCVALKSGSGPAGLAEARPTRGVSIKNCSFLNGHGGVVIGSETAGGVEDVEVSGCRFSGSDRGIRIKSRRGRGGLVQNLGFSGLEMEGVLAPITINLYYNCGARADEAARLFSVLPQPVDVLTPKFRNIRISGLTAKGCRASAGFVVGLPESKIEGLVLKDCSIDLADEGLLPPKFSEMYQGLPEIQERGMRLRNVECTLEEVRLGNFPGEGLVVEEGCELKIKRS
ncbi:MAG: glycoside hydrolase family 28 protein [Spirochaetes bacterium]|nr:glycoside hydrolase family 28 protein [Spirochaetota bacterium]